MQPWHKIKCYLKVHLVATTSDDATPRSPPYHRLNYIYFRHTGLEPWTLNPQPSSHIWYSFPHLLLSIGCPRLSAHLVTFIFIVELTSAPRSHAYNRFILILAWYINFSVQLRMSVSGSEGMGVGHSTAVVDRKNYTAHDRYQKLCNKHHRNIIISFRDWLRGRTHCASLMAILVQCNFSFSPIISFCVSFFILDIFRLK